MVIVIIIVARIILNAKTVVTVTVIRIPRRHTPNHAAAS
jgi:hypothetical protein